MNIMFVVMLYARRMFTILRKPVVYFDFRVAHTAHLHIPYGISNFKNNKIYLVMTLDQKLLVTRHVFYTRSQFLGWILPCLATSLF